MKKKLLVILLSTTMAFGLSGCYSTAEDVKVNVMREADNFNVSRRVRVINTRTESVLFERQGLISVTVSGDSRLDIITKSGDDTYTKDIIGLSEDTMFIVEDIEGVSVH